jgi:hypothetical protein
MKPSRRAVLVMLPSLACLGASEALAREAMQAGAAALVPESIARRLPGARLLGLGHYTWFGLDIYQARLFVSQQGASQQGIDAQVWTRGTLALELQYARHLKGKAIARRSRDEMRSLGLGSAAQHEEWLTLMERWFPDVHAGDTLTGVWIPDVGTEFLFNGNALGLVPDQAFALAFFGIWLSPATSAPELRKRLLGQQDAP